MRRDKKEAREPGSGRRGLSTQHRNSRRRLQQQGFSLTYPGAELGRTEILLRGAAEGAGVGGNPVQGAIGWGDKSRSPYGVTHSEGAGEFIWAMQSKGKALFLLTPWIKRAVQGSQRVHIKYPTSTVVLPVPVTFSVL